MDSGKSKQRKLNYFGHDHDGRSGLYILYMTIPTYYYLSEEPLRFYHPEEDEKDLVVSKLLVNKEHNFDRFLIAPERKNVWTGGIRSQCEGVLTAKTYKSADADRGVYTVIPEADGSRTTVETVYKMWLALESAMMRRECLIIIEDPALAHVTKFRTERWRLMNRFVGWGCMFSIIFATVAKKYSHLYLIPFTIAMYGHSMMNAMCRKDPACRYSDCGVNKQYELDASSSETCDAQISLKYLRCAHYRMFKLEDYESRDKANKDWIWFTFVYNIVAMVRNIWSLDSAHHVIRIGFDESIPYEKLQPLNIFEQLKKRFLTFGNATWPGRVDLFHWLIQNGLFYYFFLRHVPRMIQILLEYLEREYVLETSIRYLQFRNLQGEDCYEFHARNLYKTMQKDYPNSRILKELYDHYNIPPEGYYESKEYLETRMPEKVSLKEVARRWRVSCYRNW